MASALIRGVAGAAAGRTAIALADRAVVVGRDPECELSVADPSLSRRHFEVRWTADGAVVRDLGSTNGTFIAGARVEQSVVSAATEVHAGEARFEVTWRAARLDDATIVRAVPRDADANALEVAATRDASRPAEAGRGDGGRADRAAVLERTIVRPAVASTALAARADTTASPASAAPADAPGPPTGCGSGGSECGAQAPIEIYRSVDPEPIPDTPLALSPEASALLQSVGDASLYAIVDAAQHAGFAIRGRVLGHKVFTLFAGELAAEMADVGPCLIPLSPPERYVQDWVACAGSHAGVIVSSRAPFQELYAHLRAAFVVTDESGQEYFLRYYDPRVLARLISQMAPNELRELFGPVEMWVAERDDGTGFLTFRLGGDEGVPTLPDAISASATAGATGV